LPSKLNVPLVDETVPPVDKTPVFPLLPFTLNVPDPMLTEPAEAKIPLELPPVTSKVTPEVHCAKVIEPPEE